MRKVFNVVRVRIAEIRCLPPVRPSARIMRLQPKRISHILLNVTLPARTITFIQNKTLRKINRHAIRKSLTVRRETNHTRRTRRERQTTWRLAKAGKAIILIRIRNRLTIAIDWRKVRPIARKPVILTIRPIIYQRLQREEIALLTCVAKIPCRRTANHHPRRASDRQRRRESGVTGPRRRNARRQQVHVHIIKIHRLRASHAHSKCSLRTSESENLSRAVHRHRHAPQQRRTRRPSAKPPRLCVVWPRKTPASTCTRLFVRAVFSAKATPFSNACAQPFVPMESETGFTIVVVPPDALVAVMSVCASAHGGRDAVTAVTNNATNAPASLLLIRANSCNSCLFFIF